MHAPEAETLPKNHSCAFLVQHVCVSEKLQQPSIIHCDDIVVPERTQGEAAEVLEQLAADEDDASEPDSDADNGTGKKRKRRKKLKSHLRTETSRKTTGTFFKDLL